MYPYYYPGQYNNLCQQQGQCNMIKVNGIESARTYQMQPNSMIAMFDTDKDVFYVKSTDFNGNISFKAYSFALIEDKPEMVANTQYEDYISRQEFEDFKREVENYAEQFVSKSKSKSNSTSQQ